MNGSKNILKSKTFWFNVMSAAATFTGYLPPQYAAVIVPAVNIALRLLTEKPVTVLPQ